MKEKKRVTWKRRAIDIVVVLIVLAWAGWLFVLSDEQRRLLRIRIPLTLGLVQEVEFKSKYGEKEFRRTYSHVLDKPDSIPITNRDLRNLTVLSLHAYDIEILQHCRKLHSLSVGGYAEVDLSPVVLRLKNVEHLKLESNHVANWTPLDHLKKLEYLSLYRSHAQHLPPVDRITSLLFLNLQHNDISELESSDTLKRLHGLYLDHNDVEDITALADAHSIGETTLQYRNGEQIWDLGRLHWRRPANIPRKDGVVHLGLSHNRISDISSLIENPGLDQGDGLDLRGNPLNQKAYEEHIPALQGRGVYVLFDPRETPKAKHAD